MLGILVQITSMNKGMPENICVGISLPNCLAKLIRNASLQQSLLPCGNSGHCRSNTKKIMQDQYSETKCAVQTCCQWLLLYYNRTLIGSSGASTHGQGQNKNRAAPQAPPRTEAPFTAHCQHNHMTASQAWPERKPLDCAQHPQHLQWLCRHPT